MSTAERDGRGAGDDDAGAERDDARDDEDDDTAPTARLPLGVAARAQLAAAMAHEVRNPLNSLAIHGDLLQTRIERLSASLPPDERAALTKSVATMAAEIERVDRILEGYLEMVGPDEPERVATPPLSLVEAAVARAREPATSAGVRVDVRVSGGDGAAAAWPIDREAMIDAVATLVADAVSETPRGGRVEIEVTPPRDGYAELRLRAGAVRPAEALGKAFSLTGTGGAALIVARQIAKAHGGSLSIQRVDDGTLYTLRLAVD
jgi:signal transduction histidine kinase